MKLLLLALLVCSFSIKGESPNFLLILTDDQSWTATSTLMDPDNPNSKSDYYRTPAMDTILTAGMRFTRGYASGAYCTPTRRCIQVGQNTARHIYSKDPLAKWGVKYKQSMTIPRVLKSINPDYQTAHFGKWHLHYDEPHPEDLGYDVSDGNTTNAEGHTNATPPTSKETPNIVDDPKKAFDLSKRTGDFIEKQMKAGKPFFVQLSEYAVHLKIEYKQDTYDKLKNRPKGTKHALPEFASMIEDMDRALGVLMARLEKIGALENTYIIFLSDNGGRGLMPIAGQKPPVSDQSRNYPLLGSKHSIYEGGLRVPFSISGPGIKAGSVSKVPISGVDLLPTITDLAGYKKDIPNIDGGSLKNILTQQSQSVNRPYPYLVVHGTSERPLNTPHPQGKKWPKFNFKSTLVQDNYKLVKFWGHKESDDIIELYNLAEDSNEANNLMAKTPEKATDLNQLLNNYLVEVNAKTRGDNTKEKPAKKNKKKKKN